MTSHHDHDRCRQGAEQAALAMFADLSDSPDHLRYDLQFRMVENDGEICLEFTVGTSGTNYSVYCEYEGDWRWIADNLVDMLQDTVVEEWLEARPQCADHGDLLLRDMVDDAPVWVCSRCQWQAPFGQYWATVGADPKRPLLHDLHKGASIVKRVFAAQGTVKFFSSSKGYGVITPDDGGAVFVLWSEIQGDGYKSLDQGQRVEFDVSPRRRQNGGIATNVRVI